MTDITTSGPMAVFAEVGETITKQFASKLGPYRLLLESIKVGQVNPAMVKTAWKVCSGRDLDDDTASGIVRELTGLGVDDESLFSFLKERGADFFMKQFAGVKATSYMCPHCKHVEYFNV